MNTLKSKLSSVVKLFLLITVLTTVACSKDDAPSEPAVTSTFTADYNGTYSGAGTNSSNAPFAGNVTLNVTSGTTANITGDAGNYSVTGITASAGGGFNGTASGTSISISFSGAGNKDINIGGPFSFNGSKP